MHSAQLTSAPTTTASAPTPARMPTIAVPREEASDGAQEPSFAASAPGGGVAAGLLRASQVVAGRAGKVNTCEGMARAMDRAAQAHVRLCVLDISVSVKGVVPCGGGGALCFGCRVQLFLRCHMWALVHDVDCCCEG